MSIMLNKETGEVFQNQTLCFAEAHNLCWI